MNNRQESVLPFLFFSLLGTPTVKLLEIMLTTSRVSFKSRDDWPQLRQRRRRRRRRRGGGGLFFLFFLGLRVGAVLVRGSGAGGQVVEGGRSLVLVAVPAGRHPLVDAVQAPRLLEALDLVLRVEALNGCKG